MNDNGYIIYTDEISEEELDDARAWLSYEYNNDNPTDEEVWDEAIDNHQHGVEEDAITLIIPTQNPIIVYDTMGLSDGGCLCLAVLGSSVDCILHVIHQAQGPTTATIYADAEDVLFKEAYHDGVNLYTFRELLGNGEKVDELLDELRTAVCDHDAEKFKTLITTRTKSIRPYVAEAFKWD
jgi:hypothetical protein